MSQKMPTGVKGRPSFQIEPRAHCKMPSLPISSFYFALPWSPSLSLCVVCVVYWVLRLHSSFIWKPTLTLAQDTSHIQHWILSCFISPQFISARWLCDSHIFFSSRAPSLPYSHYCSAFSSPGVVFNSPHFDFGLLLPSLKSSRWLQTAFASALPETGDGHTHFPSTTATWQKGVFLVTISFVPISPLFTTFDQQDLEWHIHTICSINILLDHQ